MGDNRSMKCVRRYKEDSELMFERRDREDLIFKPGDRVKVTTEATIISSDTKSATIRYDYDAIDVNELELIEPDPVGTRRKSPFKYAEWIKINKNQWLLIHTTGYILTSEKEYKFNDEEHPIIGYIAGIEG